MGFVAACVLLGASACGWAQAMALVAVSTSAADGQVSGVVEDAQGALIPGAQVTLDENGVEKQIVSGSDGRFCFAGVPAGAFTVRAKEQGMEEGVRSGTLAAAQQVELEPMMLVVGTTMEVNAMTREEIATVQVKAEERQRIGGILPNYFVSYDADPVPLTKRLKFELGWRSVVDPANVAFVSAVAGMQQAGGSFSGYGRGASGYGKRLGAGMADATVGTMLSGSILPVVFRQDPRYFYKGTGSVRERTWYALKTAVIAKGDNGKWQPAYANVLGSFGAGAVSNLYYPAADRGAALTVENGFIAIGFDGFSNVMQEFLLRRMTPGSRREMGE
ncbi:MAG TPA: carboxypeptidase-like regulatory domain-containing protein [Acidobacteriaceae bacterium]